MNATPIRDYHEDDDSFAARVAEHRDLETFEGKAGEKLIGWGVHRVVRMHLDAPIEFDKKGAWVAVQVPVSYAEAGVDPADFEDYIS